ncbi:hypothetical protein [Haloferula rosea]|uniref:Uncharacterized protein n=1 Tax=Haloferula rosea TaxID=490093 RepID=A0A934REI5_9BACT|nr:hypothetical protein [Haloferula rosea]MBK1827666.1 hypothetical protein [Haloferula rosea]
MKTIQILFGCSALIVPVGAQDGCCGDQAPPRAVIRDAATHDSIVEAGRGRAVNPIGQLATANIPEEVKSSKPFKPESLIARSEVLKRGNTATLVPKRAVLHLPADLRGVMGLPENPQLVNWPDFLMQNRAWIRTVEVTRAQAEGQAPLSEAMLESFKDCRQVVVATYQTGPISVLPYVAPEEPAETANVEEP